MNRSMKSASRTVLTVGCEYALFCLIIQVSAKTGMNISACMDKLLDAVIAFDDIWEKEENGRCWMDD